MNADRYQRVKQLFQQALDRPAAERDAFLRKTCGNDQETLSEVRSLLKFHNTRTIVPTQTIKVSALLDKRRRRTRFSASSPLKTGGRPIRTACEPVSSPWHSRR